MLDEEWIKTLVEGRRGKITNQEMPDDGAFITPRLKARKSFIRSCGPKQKTRLVVKKSTVSSRASCQRSSNRPSTTKGGVEASLGGNSTEDDPSVSPSFFSCSSFSSSSSSSFLLLLFFHSHLSRMGNRAASLAVS